MQELAQDGLPRLSDVISQLELRADKALGQNFILDLNLTQRIAGLCGDIANRRVVEIGPGPGGLTRALLLKGARHVWTIERDHRCLPALDQIAKRWPGRLDIFHGDALIYDWQTAPSISDQTSLKEINLVNQTDPTAVIIANLPYGIATKLLTLWLNVSAWPPWYACMALMFQREVAERIVAYPGTRTYGRLSVLCQWSCKTQIKLNLPPEVFFPHPKISSAVVVFEPRPERTPACDPSALQRVTAAAFGQRRKMLRVSLRQLTSQPEVLIKEAGLYGTARAEEVTVSQYAHLARAFSRLAHEKKQHHSNVS
ncbi:MAG: 16S rRNA (adenine(1518)-N(6)/adenine(1519)-N(6))-dimethyltransferase RsmA [Hyphomicrobiaceae bacterium]